MTKNKTMSKTKEKCYGVTIEGNVQDIGFRDFVENIGRSHFLRGMVFKDIDNTVKIVCCQDSSIIEEFFNEIQTKGTKAGIKFKITDKKELPLEIPLPEKFTKVSTDDVEDIGRKLDKAYTELKGINSKLESIGNDTHVIHDLNKTMGFFVIEQREHNQRMDEHNKRLEKILEKLAEK